jgi:predicted DNA-binding transcriptional regulator AlpA
MQTAMSEKLASDRERPLSLPSQVVLAQVMSYEETAKLANISKATLQRLIAAKGGPPVIALSARRRGFRTGDVLAWLEARSISTGKSA